MWTLLTCPRVRLAALFLALGFQVHPVAAAIEPGLRAVYDTTRAEVNPAAETGPTSKVENVVLTARLTPTMLAARDGDLERIFDFTAGRVTILDHATRSSYAFPLVAEPAFREVELVNRAAMSRMFAVLGQKADLADAEAELGMLGDPPAKLRMKEERRGDERVFILNRREAVFFVPAAAAVPTVLARALERLYLFEAQLHPQVRAALVTPPRLPARLTFGFQSFGSQTTLTWQLRESALEDMDLAAAASQYPLGPLKAKPLLEAAWRVRSGKAGSPPGPADYDARVQKLLAEGRAFESFLVGMEADFAIHHMPGPLLRRARDAATSDPRMTAFLRSMDIESGRGDPQQALELLEPLDAATLDGGASIYIQRANQYVRLGNGGQALEEFGRALAINPLMFGPWHDAGWLYFNSYAMPMAWACWEAARTVLPGDPEMKDVTGLEAALRRKHPEFF